MKINYKSDFKIYEVSSIEDLSTPFIFKYYINTCECVTYKVSFDGTNYKNCRRLDDGSLLVIFDNHGLFKGHLCVERKYFLTDADFRDGICHKVTIDRSDIVLIAGASDDTQTTVEVYPFYQVGASAYDLAVADGFEGTEAEWLASLVGATGAALKYEDLTDEQKAELKGEMGNVYLMSFEVVDGELVATIPEGGNLLPSLNENGELIINVE